MKKAEYILIITSIIALIMKMFEIPFGALLFLISIMVLSLIYYPMGFAFFNNIRLRNIFKKKSYQGLKVSRIRGAIVAGIVVSTLLTGVLFTVMHYPGAQNLLIVGVFSAMVIFIVTFIKNRKVQSSYYSFVLSRIGFTGVMGVLLLIMYYWNY